MLFISSEGIQTTLLAGFHIMILKLNYLFGRGTVKAHRLDKRSAKTYLLKEYNNKIKTYLGIRISEKDSAQKHETMQFC